MIGNGVVLMLISSLGMLLPAQGGPTGTYPLVQPPVMHYTPYHQPSIMHETPYEQLSSPALTVDDSLYSQPRATHDTWNQGQYDQSFILHDTQYKRSLDRPLVTHNTQYASNNRPHTAQNTQYGLYNRPHTMHNAPYPRSFAPLLKPHRPLMFNHHMLPHLTNPWNDFSHHIVLRSVDKTEADENKTQMASDKNNSKTDKDSSEESTETTVKPPVKHPANQNVPKVIVKHNNKTLYDSEQHAQARQYGDEEDFLPSPDTDPARPPPNSYSPYNQLNNPYMQYLNHPYVYNYYPRNSQAPNSSGQIFNQGDKPIEQRTLPFPNIENLSNLLSSHGIDIPSSLLELAVQHFSNGDKHPEDNTYENTGEKPLSFYAGPTISQYGGSTPAEYGEPPPSLYGGPSPPPYGVPPPAHYGASPPPSYGVPPPAHYGASPQPQYGVPPPAHYGASPQSQYVVPPSAHYGASPAPLYGVPPPAHFGGLSPSPQYGAPPPAHYGALPPSQFGASSSPHYGAPPPLSQSVFGKPLSGKPVGAPYPALIYPINSHHGVKHDEIPDTQDSPLGNLSPQKFDDPQQGLQSAFGGPVIPVGDLSKPPSLISNVHGVSPSSDPEYPSQPLNLSPLLSSRPLHAQPIHAGLIQASPVISVGTPVKPAGILGVPVYSPLHLQPLRPKLIGEKDPLKSLPLSSNQSPCHRAEHKPN